MLISVALRLISSSKLLLVVKFSFLNDDGWIFFLAIPVLYLVLFECSKRFKAS